MVAYKVTDNKVTCILVDRHHGRLRKYYGEAVCAPEDTFNVEKGKKIAFIRARLMELGENEAKNHKWRTHVQSIFDSIFNKLNIQLGNIAATKDRLRKELKETYES